MGGGKKKPKQRKPGGRPPASGARRPIAAPAAEQPAPPKPTRAERLEAARRKRQRRRLLVRGGVALVAAVLGAAVLLTVLGNRRETGELRARLTAGSCRFDTRSDPTDAVGANHVPNPVYRVNPPAGGNHSARAAAAGTYTEASAPPDGELVHALEHGYVILWHRTGLGDDGMGPINRVADRFERDVLVVPRATLDVPVAATAWGRRLLCREVEEASLRTFVEEYRNKGPERVPH